MTKDSSKRVKELEKDKKSLEQKNAQAEKVMFTPQKNNSIFFFSHSQQTITTLEAKNTTLTNDLASKEKALADVETKAEKLEQSKR